MSEALDPAAVPAAGEDNITTSSTHHGDVVPVETTAAAAKPDGEGVAAGDKPGEAVEPAKPPEETEDEKKAKGQERLNARFSELTGQRETAKAEAASERARADAAEAELARLRPAPQTPAEAQPADGAPDPTKYEMGEFDPKFIQDTIQHGIRAALAEQGERQAETQARQQYADRVETVRGKLMDSGLAGAALLASGDPSIKCTPVMIDVLATLENAPQVADNLASNPAEAARIASLPPHLQGLELARIDARLAGAKTVTTTNAPEPTRTLAGLAPASDEFDPNMSQADFEAQHIRKYGSFASR